jgi:hypothetical protein
MFVNTSRALVGAGVAADKNVRAPASLRLAQILRYMYPPRRIRDRGTAWLNSLTRPRRITNYQSQVSDYHSTFVLAQSRLLSYSFFR